MTMHDNEDRECDFLTGEQYLEFTPSTLTVRCVCIALYFSFIYFAT